jgi:hypothetical protein
MKYHELDLGTGGMWQELVLHTSADKTNFGGGVHGGARQGAPAEHYSQYVSAQYTAFSRPPLSAQRFQPSVARRIRKQAHQESRGTSKNRDPSGLVCAFIRLPEVMTGRGAPITAHSVPAPPDAQQAHPGGAEDEDQRPQCAHPSTQRFHLARTAQQVKPGGGDRQLRGACAWA